MSTGNLQPPVDDGNVLEMLQNQAGIIIHGEMPGRQTSGERRHLPCINFKDSACPAEPFMSCVATGGPGISWTSQDIPEDHSYSPSPGQIRCTTSTGWSHNSVLC